MLDIESESFYCFCSIQCASRFDLCVILDIRVTMSETIDLKSALAGLQGKFDICACMFVCMHVGYCCCYTDGLIFTVIETELS